MGVELYLIKSKLFDMRVNAIFIILILFFPLCKCDKAQNKKNIVLSKGNCYTKTIESFSIDRSILSTKNSIIDSSFVVRVCGYPYVVGPDFNSLYTVLEIIGCSNSSKSIFPGEQIIVEYDEEIIKKIESHQFISAKNNQNIICESNLPDEIFFGKLIELKKWVIDRTTGAKYSGYLLLADSVFVCK